MIVIASTFSCAEIKGSLLCTISHATSADLRPIHFTQLAEFTPTVASLHSVLTGTVIIFRIEDWIRSDIESGYGSDTELRRRLRLQIDEFAIQLGMLSSMGKPVWVLACPSTGWVAESTQLSGLFRTFTNLAVARARSVSGVTLLTWPDDLSAPGAVNRDTDASSQVPFGPSALDSLGKSIGKQIEETLEAADPPDRTPGRPTELADYLRRLNVCVDLRYAGESDRTDIERLLRTVSAFSLTGEISTISNGDLDNLLRGRECLVIVVSDRHSSYGCSGVAIFRLTRDELVVESFALSCPVLGKQVEFAVLDVLGSVARELALARIAFEYQASARNQTMLAFLEQVADPSPKGGYVVRTDTVEERIREAALANRAWTLTVTGMTLNQPSGLSHSRP
jgi:hypothetical protein